MSFKHSFQQPDLIFHCDWSVNPDRRWMAKAILKNGRYVADTPKQVGDLSTFLKRIQDQHSDSGSILIGFDFPIGLPKAYAKKIGVIRFQNFLKSLPTEAEFFRVCKHQTEISLKRPFYPNAPGGKLLAHLTDAHGVTRDELLRACDQATETRNAAAALFWTLGAKQVGKAAIKGWAEVLAPALRANGIKIWPFDGPLYSLLKPAATVIAETYPAQYYADIFVALAGRKGDQRVRAEAAPQILKWIKSRSEYLELSPKLEAEIHIGFSTGKDDAFDAAIGLFGMIDALQNYGPALEPIDPTIRNIEGWILGQQIT